MLEDLWIGPGGPETLWPHGPALGIAAEKNENGDANHQQRPILRPFSAASARQYGEHPHGNHDQAHPVMVVLRPLSVVQTSQGKRRTLAVIGNDLPRGVERRNI